MKTPWYTARIKHSYKSDFLINKIPGIQEVIRVPAAEFF